ncbi:hypothetical protein Neosp_013777 [[Neocosmospora] mangrovei]
MDLDEDLVDLAGSNLWSLEELREVMPKTESMSTRATRWIIHPQDSCPLFTRFPSEIRQGIFSYALSEHNSHSDIKGQPRVQLPVPEPKWLVCDLPESTSKPMPEHSSLEGFDLSYYSPQTISVEEFDRKCPVWLRPGTSAVRFQHTSLLRTCRRIFLEARDLLMKNATLRIFTDIREMKNAGVAMHSMGRMTRYIANRLTSLEIYTDQLQLEENFLAMYDEYENLRCIEDLRITLRKNDWRDGSDIYGPQLTPYGDGRGRDLEHEGWTLMEEHMELEEERGQSRPPIPPIPYTRQPQELEDETQTWGESLSMIPNLKRFTMDFEYSEDQFQGLKKLAEWAQRVWTFRLGGKMKGYYLSARDNPIKVYSWRGLTPHMGVDIICPNEDCPQSRDLDDEDDSNDSLYREGEDSECCAETYKRMEHGFGPRMYTFTVTWTARKLEPEDGDDPTIPGADELKSQWPEVRRDGLTAFESFSAFDVRGLYCSGIPVAFQDHRLLHRGL